MKEARSQGKLANAALCAFLTTAALALVTGCSGESAGDGDDSGGGGSGASSSTGGTSGATGGSGGTAGGTTGGTAGSAGTAGSGADSGAGCNDLVPATQAVEYRLDTGVAPEATGGVLVAGVYDLTSVVVYGDEDNCLDPYRSIELRYTLSVETTSPTSGRNEVLLTAIGTEERANSSYVIDATELVSTPLCGDAMEDRDFYSATETTLTVSLPAACGTANLVLTHR